MISFYLWTFRQQNEVEYCEGFAMNLIKSVCIIVIFLFQVLLFE